MQIQQIGSTVPRLGASMQGTLMSKRVLYPPPLSRSPSFHMEGGLGKFNRVANCSRKKAVSNARKSPLSLKEGGPR